MDEKMVKSERHFGFWLCSVFLCVILFRQEYQIWFGAEGMPYLHRLAKTHAVQAHKNSVLEDENELLLSQIHRYKSSSEAIEGAIRSHMHMIKKKELFFAYPMRGHDAA